MADGFLGYKSSFMLDVVVCALVVLVPVIAFSLYQVRWRRNYTLHRNLQILLGVILLVAVTAFEIDVQLVHGGWEKIVQKRPTPPERIEFLRRVLWVHLVFAVATPLLWGYTLVMALKQFPKLPEPCAYSRMHRVLGWVSTVDIVLTSITGLAFYYLAIIR